MPTETPVIVNQEYLEDIADAIRAKNGSLDTYTPAEMAQAIADLSSGSGNNGSLLDSSWENNWVADYRSNSTLDDVRIVTSTTGSAARIKGLSKLNATGAELVHDLTHNSFVMYLKDRILSGVYIQGMWTPNGYLYQKENQFTYWFPTLVWYLDSTHAAPGWRFRAPAPFAAPGQNTNSYKGFKSTGDIESYDNGWYFPVFKMEELENNTASSVTEITTSTIPQVSIYARRNVTGTLYTSSPRWSIPDNMDRHISFFYVPG